VLTNLLKLQHSASVALPEFCTRMGGVHVHEIRHKSDTFLHKYNKLTMSRLQRLWICGWNWKMCTCPSTP